MAQIIEVLKPDEAYVDAADTIEHRFGNHIRECLKTKTKIISKHKADRIFPIVSAASIIAKVERDREVASLKYKYGDFGTGYLTDEKTMVFLRGLLKKLMIILILLGNLGSPRKEQKAKRAFCKQKLA